MAGGKETPKEEEKQEPSVRRGSKSIWPWKKETDGSASFLRAARAGNLEKVLEFLKTNTDINTCNANGLNALHLASKEGHTNVVSALLERNANVDSATKKGNTALHIASLAGQDEIVKVLVENGACVNIQSQNGFTPLYMAAQENHDSVVRFLLSHGANQSLATEDGFTPLAVALQQGHDRVVSVLLENDTKGKVRLPALHIAAKKDDAKAAALLLHTDHNPDITSKSGFTPLHIASHYGNDNIAGLLIQRGADVNYVAKHQITPLHVASKWGKGNMVSLLLDKGANIEAKTRDGLTPLHCAARSGHETVVDMLLEKGAPITAKTKNGLAPLHMASQGDHVDAARILLYHKAPVDDVTVDFLTALHVAAHCGHVRVAKLLLDRKADPNSRALNGFTPLHIACKKNRIKVVELLLKHGASIEATTESGLTPLHVASFMGCMNIVIYLIQHGATADVPTVRGESPLHLAARANQTDIIRILLRNGAEVDAKAREQQTALHIASRLGNTDIVGLLLQQGASVDAPTKDLYTPLHIAAKEGQEEVAGVLLDHGASLNTPTKKGFTPLHLAAKYGHMKVARLLLQREAPVDPKGKNGVTPLHVAAHYDHQNVAMLLLDKGAQPHATAKNGYTPLHIAARKNQMDIAGTLLEYGANANAESKAGFTPLHLSAQEGHADMATLLLEHGAQPGGAAKNGLTPLHLCAQEDRVPVGAILVKHGAAVDSQTKAGYTPLHVASHFGQMNMVRFLLQHGTKVDAPTQLGYTPLHQAAQQGHTQIVNILLENKAQPNMETNDGKTALSIAQRLGYISVVETLKIVTETRVTTNTTTTTEEKYKVVVPETMYETFMSESEDEGADDTMLGDQSYRYLTVDEMKSLGDDSLPIDVTRDEKMDVSFVSNANVGSAPGEHISPQHKKEMMYSQNYPTDNVDVGKAPILAGPESLNTTMNTSFNPTEDDALIVNDESRTEVPDQGATRLSQARATVTPKATQNEEITTNIWDQFLVSFMVDARGGAMRGCRHSGVRVIIPPRKAAMPMRITCRYLKKDKLVHAPPLMEGEALGSRILEMGPSGAKFLGPVIIEVPHFASLRGKEREIVILRSDNGETWREHTLEATEEAVQEVLNESFDGEELKQLEDLNTNRITRILTTDFPQYFAIVTRIRQEVHAIGPEGGMVSSTVVPQVQAVFPQGALTKKIKVGLQAQPISTELVAKLLGNRVAVSPIVTVEPRRRKFHKPITLTIPVPQAASKGMINQYSGEAPTLRLLCSITGGTTRAQWEDVTGSTPLTFVNDCVSFTTTVSARFWLMDCTNIPEATKMATELYREAIHVPFMAKFVVFSKRHQLEEARVRVFCMTDDKEDKTLESQEHFIEVAKSRDVEVLEGKSQYLEFAGNLIPVTKSGDQLAFNFYAFRENRLPFTVRVKDQNAEPVGRVAFMRQPKVGRGEAPQSPICNLNLSLPDNIQPEPAPSEPDLLALEKKYAFLSISKAETIHKADLRLSDISNMLAGDWVALAKELKVSDSDINIIKSQYPDNAPQQAIVMLRLWMQTFGNRATGNTLEKALRAIHRNDIVDECICNLEVVTDDSEKATAEEVLEHPVEPFSKSLQQTSNEKSEPTSDIVYDEKDLMKDAESADEDEIAQKILPDGFTQPSAEASQMVPGDTAPTDVKPPVSAADQATSEVPRTEKAAGAGSSRTQVKYEHVKNPSENIIQVASPSLDSSTNVIVSDDGLIDFNIINSLNLNNKSSADITTSLNNSNSFSNFENNEAARNAVQMAEYLNESSGTQVNYEEALIEAFSHSAHRPTTLKFSTSSEVNENEIKTNDSCVDNARKNELLSEESRELFSKQLLYEDEAGAPKKDVNNLSNQSSKLTEGTSQTVQVSSGAIPRQERSIRPSARSAAVLKVKVEKRPISNHSNRERLLHASFKETVQSVPQVSIVSAPSKAQNTTVEDEVIGLMAEMKEVTNQIKKEVRQLRESETPTPDTPTPLREFRDFLCKEEEQELDRLPTITETGKETEEDGSSSGMPGEMDYNLTFKNHTSTNCPSMDRGQHTTSEKNMGHTPLSLNNNKSSHFFNENLTTLRSNINNSVINNLEYSPHCVKSIVNIETPLLTPSSSIYSRLNQDSFVNNTLNINTIPEKKVWDISSVIFNKTDQFSVHSNHFCNYCTKDFLLNDVCNELGNIISLVEEGIRVSKMINFDRILTSLEALKFKVGGIFGNSSSINSKYDESQSLDVNDFSTFKKEPEKETGRTESEIERIQVFNESMKMSNQQLMPSVQDITTDIPLTIERVSSEANDQEYFTDSDEICNGREEVSYFFPLNTEQIVSDISDDKSSDEDIIEPNESNVELIKEVVSNHFQKVSSFLEECDTDPIRMVSEDEFKNLNTENSYTRNIRNEMRPVVKKEFLDLQDTLQDLTNREHISDSAEVDFHSKVTKGNEKSMGNEKSTIDGMEINQKTLANQKNFRPKRKKQRQKKSKLLQKTSSDLTIAASSEDGTNFELLSTSSDSSSNNENIDDFTDNILVPTDDFRALCDIQDIHSSDSEDEDMIEPLILDDENSFISEAYTKDINTFEETYVQLNINEEFQMVELDNENQEILPSSNFNLLSAIKPQQYDSDDDNVKSALTDLDDVIKEIENEYISDDVNQRMLNDDTTMASKTFHSDMVSNVKSETPSEANDVVNSSTNDGLVTDINERNQITDVTIFKKKPEKLISYSSNTDIYNIDNSKAEAISHQRRYKKIICETKHLPLVSQISEIKLVETDRGPFSIIITPKSVNDPIKDKYSKDYLKGVMFLELRDDTTYVEEVYVLNEEGTKNVVSDSAVIEEMNTEETEDIDITSSDCSKTSTSHEKCIIEDQYKAPHIKVEHLKDYEIANPDENEQSSRSTKDVQMHDNKIFQSSNVADSDDESSRMLAELELSEISTIINNQNYEKLNEPSTKTEEDDRKDLGKIWPVKRGKRKVKRKKPRHDFEVEENAKADVDPLVNVSYSKKTTSTDHEQFETSQQKLCKLSVDDIVPSPDAVDNTSSLHTIENEQEGTIRTDIHEHEEPKGLEMVSLKQDLNETSNIQNIGCSEIDEPVSKDQIQSNLPEHKSPNLIRSIRAFTTLAKRLNRAKIKDSPLLPENIDRSPSDVELDKREETGEPQAAKEDESKPEASKKSPLIEADLAVLESILTSEEAEIEEMEFAQEQTSNKLVLSSQSSDQKTSEMQTCPTSEKLKLPPKDTQKLPKTPPLPSSRKWFAKIDPKESTQIQKIKRTTPEVSSDEGEDQLALMKDSPRWEEEEIQTEDTDNARPIKAEIKLLVKTTEIGKESIEIRSIREFVDRNEKGNPEQQENKKLSLDQNVEDRESSLKPSISKVSASSPKFVRPAEKYPSLYEEGNDDFDLMAQVRDILTETENAKDLNTQYDSPKETQKKKKSPK